MENETKHIISADELWEVWPTLHEEERKDWFAQLERGEAEDFFSSMTPEDQAILLEHLDTKERRLWMRTLAPDDAADVLQEVSSEELKNEFIGYLPDKTQKETKALLAYAEDDAGGLMSPRFGRLRPDMTVDEAISYLRKQLSDELETMYYVYVLDSQQHLLGVVAFSALFKANGHSIIRDIMETDLITIDDTADQEAVAILFAREDLFALPVVDKDGCMKGIITIDDIVDVVQEEATEDIQKLGGMSALDTSYFQTDLKDMIKKRLGWLVVLFFGSLITTQAMQSYEDAMSKAAILSVFVPLIISCGGNTGSQAATLITRAMALDELHLRDALLVFKREFLVGAFLGVIIGLLGFGRVVVGQWLGLSDVDVYLTLAMCVSLSIMVCVLCGSLVGSMLPFLLKLCKVDPATASAPFVATLVDVTGVIIYFTFATLLLSGTLLPA